MFSIDSVVATRRDSLCLTFRGLKPTAKVMRPLRGQNIADLTAMADAFAEHVAATADTSAKIREGMIAKRILEGVVQNEYSNDPGKLAAWLRASQPKKHGRKSCHRRHKGISHMRISILFFLLFLATSVTLSAQSRGNKIKAAIEQYASGVVSLLNRNKEKYRYKVENKNTFNSDVDGDGDLDAVVEIFFCEKTNCHATTNSSRLAIFLNAKGTYRLAADKSFILYGKINSVDEGTINIDVYGLDDDDPQCCPEIKRFEKYVFKGNRLVKMKR